MFRDAMGAGEECHHRTGNLRLAAALPSCKPDGHFAHAAQRNALIFEQPQTRFRIAPRGLVGFGQAAQKVAIVVERQAAGHRMLLKLCPSAYPSRVGITMADAAARLARSRHLAHL
jgi:hypothetical protein